MEKKNGLSDEHIPPSTFGARFRSQPAALSAETLLSVTAIVPFFAAPQLNAAGPLSAGGTGNTGCGVAEANGDGRAAPGALGSPGILAAAAPGAAVPEAVGVSCAAAGAGCACATVTARARAKSWPGKLRIGLPSNVESVQPGNRSTCRPVWSTTGHCDCRTRVRCDGLHAQPAPIATHADSAQPRRVSRRRAAHRHRERVGGRRLCWLHGSKDPWMSRLETSSGWRRRSERHGWPIGWGIARVTPGKP